MIEYKNQQDRSFTGFALETVGMTVGPIVGLSIMATTGTPDMSYDAWANTERKPVTKIGTVARLGLTAVWLTAAVNAASHNQPHVVEAALDTTFAVACGTGLILSRVNAYAKQPELPQPTDIELPYPDTDV